MGSNEPKTIQELNESFILPEGDQKQASIIMDGARLVNWLVNHGKPSHDLHETSQNAQRFFRRKLQNGEQKELTSLSPELHAYWETLRKSGGLITLDHPTKVFLDPTAILSLLPPDIWEKTKIITSTYQFPMNQSLFDRGKIGRFVPAIARREYIEQLRLLEEHVKDGGIVLLIPNGTEEIFQGTFRKMLKKWNPDTPIVDFHMEHSTPFQEYPKLLVDAAQFWKKHPITTSHTLTTLGAMKQEK